MTPKFFILGFSEWWIHYFEIFDPRYFHMHTSSVRVHPTRTSLAYGFVLNHLAFALNLVFRLLWWHEQDTCWFRRIWTFSFVEAQAFLQRSLQLLERLRQMLFIQSKTLSCSWAHSIAFQTTKSRAPRARFKRNCTNRVRSRILVFRPPAKMFRINRECWRRERENFAVFG